MIRLKIENKDFSQVVEKITWSGDTKQVARKLVFTIAQRASDRFLPKVTVSEGDLVLLEEDGVALFGGKIFDVDKSSKSSTFTYTAFDFMFYVQQNEISRIIDTTADDHQRLATLLKGIKGRFILSYDDNPMIRELYSWCSVEGIIRNTTLAGNSDNKVPFAEIIVKNL